MKTPKIHYMKKDNFTIGEIQMTTNVLTKNQSHYLSKMLMSIKTMKNRLFTYYCYKFHGIQPLQRL